MSSKIRNAVGLSAAATLLLLSAAAGASSHREAPFITQNPKVDGTDFYMFRSYEPGREGYVTLIANYQPLQVPQAAPNYYMMDPNALYEIHIDNDGDAREDLTFQFRFQQHLKDIALDIGTPGATKSVSVPLLSVGPITADDTSKLNVIETYKVALVRGHRRHGRRHQLSNLADGKTVFTKPVDNIGPKTIADYEGYACAHHYEVKIPGCRQDDGSRGPSTARIFVGQRKDPFVVAVGPIFDLINLNPIGPAEQGLDGLKNANVTTFAVEVPIGCVTRSARKPIIGGWTTASLRQVRLTDPYPHGLAGSVEGGAWVQVSRLGSPLVNELVIGLKDKNLFNSSAPADDAQFIDYVTNPVLPAFIELLYGAAGAVAPKLFPRADLIAVFLTGVEGVNKTETPSEMQRLNTAIPATPRAAQNNLGAALCFVAGTLTLDNPGCDPAGHPNGRRPGDDVVDIALRVVMGYLLPADVAPAGTLPFTDGASTDASRYYDQFPYATSPLPLNAALEVR